MSEETSKYVVTTMCSSPDNAPLTLNEYQQRAMSTCMDSCSNFSYMFLNLVGEVGELASKVAKHIRKDKAEIVDNHLCNGADETLSESDLIDMRRECGDIAW